MKLVPLENKSTIIWKLTKGYITNIDVFIDLINIDESNDTLEYTINDMSYSITIPHKLYANTDEIAEILISRFSSIGIELTFSESTFTFNTPISIVKNSFTDFIGMVISGTYDYLDKSDINKYVITKNTLPKPSVFYVYISTIPEITTNDSTYALKIIESLDIGQNSIAINFQNNYDNLYLLISSNVNKYPLKYNSEAILNIV